MSDPSTPTSPEPLDPSRYDRQARNYEADGMHGVAELITDLTAEVRRLRARLDMPCGSCHPCNNYGGSKERNDSLMAALESVEAERDALHERFLNQMQAATELIANLEATEAERDALRADQGDNEKLARRVGELWDENAALRAVIQAVTKLCDEYRANCDPTSTQAQVAEYFRAALAAAGVDRDTGVGASDGTSNTQTPQLEVDREDTEQPQYKCALCGGSLTVSDNYGGGLITVNVAGHAKPAHRTCPVGDTEQPGGAYKRAVDFAAATTQDEKIAVLTRGLPVGDTGQADEPQPCDAVCAKLGCTDDCGASQVVPQQPTCDCYPDPRDHEPGCPVGQDTTGEQQQ